VTYGGKSLQLPLAEWCRFEISVGNPERGVDESAISALICSLDESDDGRGDGCRVVGGETISLLALCDVTAIIPVDLLRRCGKLADWLCQEKRHHQDKDIGKRE
jgi:hypothetical protein